METAIGINKAILHNCWISIRTWVFSEQELDLSSDSTATFC